MVKALQIKLQHAWVNSSLEAPGM